ncbi:MAG: hypothetical protein ABEJ30_06125 [Halorientalis sp.]
MSGRIQAWTSAVGWGLAGTVGALWLALLALVVVGFLLGGPAAADAPAIDASEPPAEVAADALARLEAVPHTTELWFRSTNYNRGRRTGGILLRVHVEPGTGAVRLGQWRGALDGDDVVLPSAAHDQFFVQGPVRWRRPAGADSWHRAPLGADVLGGGSDALPVDPDALRSANVSVVRETGDRLVLAVADTGPLREGRQPPEQTARIVVDTGSTPHLERLAFVTQRETGSQRWLYRVTNWGTARARRPPSVPGTTVTGVLARSARGLSRLT